MRFKTGDWLAVKDKDGRVYSVLEVVGIQAGLISGFELFPNDGVPVNRIQARRCLPFRKPRSRK